MSTETMKPDTGIDPGGGGGSFGISTERNGINPGQGGGSDQIDPYNGD